MSHIVHLLSSMSRNAGGLFESVRRLSLSVAERGRMEVSIVALQDEFSEADEAAWDPLPLRLCRVLGPKAFGWSPAFRRALSETGADIVHTHGLWMYPSRACVKWGRRAGRPWMISPHGMLDPWALRNSSFKKSVARFLYEDAHLHGAACLRALCAAELRAIRACGLTNPVCLVPNGIELPEENGHAPPPWDGSAKTLLFLGRLHPKKNIAALLRAWNSVERERGPSQDWGLAIAGWDQGGHLRELRSIAAESRRVQFLGPLHGPPKHAALSQCSAFVLPSLSEGLPMAVLEAWAHSRPVLMTAECNLPEGFERGAAIPVGHSPDAIADGLRALVRLPDDALQDMGRRGRQLAAADFTWTRVAESMESVYQWLLAGGSPPPCVEIPRRAS